MGSLGPGSYWEMAFDQLMVLNPAHLQKGDVQKYSAEPKAQRFGLLNMGGRPRAAHNVPDGSHKPPGRLEATVIDV